MGPCIVSFRYSDKESLTSLPQHFKKNATICIISAKAYSHYSSVPIIINEGRQRLILPSWSMLSVLSWFIPAGYYHIRNDRTELTGLVQIPGLVAGIISIIIIAFQNLSGFVVFKRTDNELRDISSFYQVLSRVSKETWGGQCILLFNAVS